HPDTVITAKGVTATGRENDPSSGFGLQPGNERELDVVANRDADRTKGGLENLDLITALDAPNFPFPSGRDDFVLKADCPIGGKKVGPIPNSGSTVSYRQAAGEDVDAMPCGKIGMNGDKFGQQSLDCRCLPFQAGLDAAGGLHDRKGAQFMSRRRAPVRCDAPVMERSKLHPGEFRKYQQFGTGAGGLCNPAVKLAAQFLVRRAMFDCILRGRYAHLG